MIFDFLHKYLHLVRRYTSYKLINDEWLGENMWRKRYGRISLIQLCQSLIGLSMVTHPISFSKKSMIFITPLRSLIREQNIIFYKGVKTSP